jgi:DNA-binding MarR family transcriptional regulator
VPKNPEAFGAWMKLDKPDHIVGFLLKSLQHTLRQTLDEALRKQGIELSFAQFGALFGLHCEPGSTGAKLARRAFVSAQTMNTVLRRLEEDGLIERRPHPDTQRADCWSLTPDGLAQLHRARNVGNAIFEKMLAPLERAEIASLVSSLRRCIKALEGDADGAVAGEAVDPPARRVSRRPADRPAAR